MLSPKLVLVIAAVATQVISGGTPNYARNPRHRIAHTKREITKEWPHLVKLGYDSKYGWLWQCTGALISQDTIVTAANCTKPKGGELKIINIQEKNFNIAQVRTINEIAVLYLEKPIADSLVIPSCLSPISDVRKALVAGWAGLLPDNQLHGTINKRVSKTEVSVSKTSGNTIKAKPTKGSACVVDRGGPLQIPSNKHGCRYEIIGVLQQWEHCGENNSFGVYTDLRSYIEIIEES